MHALCVLGATITNEQNELHSIGAYFENKGENIHILKLKCKAILSNIFKMKYYY